MARFWTAKMRAGAALVAVTTGLWAGGLLASASAAPGSQRVGSAPQVPYGARVLGGLPGTTDLAVDIALSPRDPEALETYAQDVSTPGSAVYRHYLSVAAFRAAFAPTADQVAAVDSELRSAGLVPGAVSANGLTIHIRAPAAALARAFATGFSEVHLRSGRTAFTNTAAPEFSAGVAPLVQGVVGLNDLSTLHTPGAGESSSANASPALSAQDSGTGTLTAPCGDATSAAAAYAQDSFSGSPVTTYTAPQIAGTYGFDGLYSAGDFGAGQSVALLELEPYNSDDIAAYQNCYGTNATVTPTVVDSGVTGSDDVEAALDIEQIIGLAPQAAVDVYEAPNSDQGFVDDLAQIVSADTDKTISISWVECEPAMENVTVTEGSQSVGLLQTERTLFMEAATQGQSVYAASGDEGASGCYDPASSSPDTSAEVTDPASQPDVTGVGGTSLPGVDETTAQSTWSDDAGASGGGLSKEWAAPSYQANAASSLGVMAAQQAVYAEGNPIPCPASSCREVPDVSADADPYTGYLFYVSAGNPSSGWYGSNWYDAAGTSAAAPLWAALNALANASSSCGGKDIGFANPVLYSVAASDYGNAFTDVTSGSNNLVWSGSSDFYSAGAGYDLTTGLGTPNAASLVPDMCKVKVGSSSSGSSSGSGTISGGSGGGSVSTPTPTPTPTPTATPTPAPTPTPTTSTPGVPAPTVTTASKTPAVTCAARTDVLRRSVLTLALSARHRSASYSVAKQTLPKLPQGCTHLTLDLDGHVVTTQSKGARAVDTLKVEVLSARTKKVLTTVTTLSNRNARSGYQAASLSLSRYADQSVIIRFAAAGSGRRSTSFSLRTLELKLS